MDFKMFWTAFGAIFVAELADKTQLMGISLAASSKKPYTVFLGSVAAYCIVTALSVTLGGLLHALIKPEYIRYGGGIIFVTIGIFLFCNKV